MKDERDRMVTICLDASQSLVELESDLNVVHCTKWCTVIIKKKRQQGCKIL